MEDKYKRHIRKESNHKKCIAEIEEKITSLK